MLAALSLSSLLLLVVYAIVAVIVLGALWWVVNRLAVEFGLPGWVPLVVLVIVTLIVLVWLASGLEGETVGVIRRM
jgi:hypothetical protein